MKPSCGQLQQVLHCIALQWFEAEMRSRSVAGIRWEVLEVKLGPKEMCKWHLRVGCNRFAGAGRGMAAAWPSPGAGVMSHQVRYDAAHRQLLRSVMTRE